MDLEIEKSMLKDGFLGGEVDKKVSPTSAKEAIKAALEGKLARTKMAKA